MLRGLDLTIEPGRITAIAGPNAAGKTTLIKAILGLVRADRHGLVQRGLGAYLCRNGNVLPGQGLRRGRAHGGDEGHGDSEGRDEKSSGHAQPPSRSLIRFGFEP